VVLVALDNDSLFLSLYRSIGMKSLLGFSPGSFPILAVFVIDKESYLQKYRHIVYLCEQIHITSKS
jgi:hypothetical protein